MTIEQLLKAREIYYDIIDIEESLRHLEYSSEILLYKDTRQSGKRPGGLSEEILQNLKDACSNELKKEKAELLAKLEKL